MIRPRKSRSTLQHAILAPLVSLFFCVAANAAQWPEPMPTVPHYELPPPPPDTAALKPPHYTSRQTSDDTHKQQERQGEPFRQWLVTLYQKTIDDPVALFTLVLAISTILLWFVTRKSANAARDAAEVLPATERPYVLIIGGGFLQVSSEVTQDSRPVVLYRCGNFGKTPAIIENLRAGFTRNSNGQPDSPNRVEDTHGLLLARILKGGEEISPLWVVCPDDWITGDVAVTRGENVLLVRQPTTTEGEELFLRIIVNYRGAFTKGHETSVCWKFCFGEHMFLQYGGNEYNYER